MKVTTTLKVTTMVTQVPAITPAVTPAIEPSVTTIRSITFRADEVGYFDPDLDSDRDMVTIGKDLWFRDVFLFTNRLKDTAITKDVRTNRTACLRGTALTGIKANGMVMILPRIPQIRRPR
jgi:hypothetical protein